MSHSQTAQGHSQPKTSFKVKLRKSSQESPAANRSLRLDRLSQTQRVMPSKEFMEQKSEHFKQTASKLTQSNFEPHYSRGWLEDECNCGRHLSKLHVVKPDMNKNTIYRNTYQQFKRIPNIVNHDKEYDKLKGPHLDINSTYSQGFRGKAGDQIDRPHPEDLIKSSGPCPKLSTYSSHFPGHKGQNQYVKPTDRHTRDEFPLRSKSTYSHEFSSKKKQDDDYSYFPDQLRTGSRWFGKTTYGDFFSNPNPEYMAKQVKIVEKLEENPNFNRQYRTFPLTEKPPTRTIS